MKSKKQYIAPALKEYSYESEEGYGLSITNYLAAEQDDLGFEHGQEVWSWESENENENRFGGDTWGWQ